MTSVAHEQKHIFSNYKSKAKKKGVQFCLTLTEFVELCEQPCFYCGAEQSVGKLWRRNGVDRIVPSTGYSKDNLCSCCCVCNRMKSDVSLAVFLFYVKRVSQFNS